MKELMTAITKSIRAYYEDNAFEETSKTGEIKYNKSYFDDFEKQQFDLSPKEIENGAEEDLDEDVK